MSQGGKGFWPPGVEAPPLFVGTGTAPALASLSGSPECLLSRRLRDAPRVAAVGWGEEAGQRRGAGQGRGVGGGSRPGLGVGFLNAKRELVRI